MGIFDWKHWIVILVVVVHCCANSAHHFAPE